MSTRSHRTPARTIHRTLSLALALVAAGACASDQADIAADPALVPTAGAGGAAAGAAVGAGAGADAGATGTPSGSGGVAGVSDPGGGGSAGDAGMSDAGRGGAGAPDWTAPCDAKPGPPMVRVPAPDGTTYCIDTTEVTMAHYAAFLAEKKDDLSGQRAICQTNTSFVPPGDSDNSLISCPDGYFQPEKRANWPMGCVDFCDADAYCAWAGKRLCGHLGGGPLTAEASIDPQQSEWVNACTQGGKTKLPYGDTFEDGRCIDRTRVPDGAGSEGLAVLADPQKNAPECRGTEPPFDQIYSMSVGMNEWDDSVVGDTPNVATAGIRGGGFGDSSKNVVPPSCAESDGEQARTYLAAVGTDIGFRCCGD
jgi:formylglycine-generating enzyme